MPRRTARPPSRHGRTAGRSRLGTRHQPGPGQVAAITRRTGRAARNRDAVDSHVPEPGLDNDSALASTARGRTRRSPSPSTAGAQEPLPAREQLHERLAVRGPAGSRSTGPSAACTLRGGTHCASPARPRACAHTSAAQPAIELVLDRALNDQLRASDAPTTRPADPEPADPPAAHRPLLNLADGYVTFTAGPFNRLAGLEDLRRRLEKVCVAGSSSRTRGPGSGCGPTPRSSAATASACCSARREGSSSVRSSASIARAAAAIGIRTGRVTLFALILFGDVTLRRLQRTAADRRSAVGQSKSLEIWWLRRVVVSRPNIARANSSVRQSSGLVDRSAAGALEFRLPYRRRPLAPVEQERRVVAAGRRGRSAGG